jgi:hypothetical protein
MMPGCYRPKIAGATSAHKAARQRPLLDRFDTPENHSFPPWIAGKTTNRFNKAG